MNKVNKDEIILKLVAENDKMKTLLQAISDFLNNDVIDKSNRVLMQLDIEKILNKANPKQ